MHGYSNILTERSYLTARHSLSGELAAAETAHRQAAFSAATGGGADATAALAVVTNVRARIANLDAAREQAKVNDAGAQAAGLQFARDAHGGAAKVAYAKRDAALVHIARLVGELEPHVVAFVETSRDGPSAVRGLTPVDANGFNVTADRLAGQDHVHKWLAGTLFRMGALSDFSGKESASFSVGKNLVTLDRDRTYSALARIAEDVPELRGIAPGDEA